MKPYLLIIILFFTSFCAHAQDPFFTHFFNNESDFNPAMTGQKGALSVTAKYKSQWAGNDAPAYISGSATMEESLPCSILDYGFHFNFDEEGAGRFRTYDAGFRVAGTAPFNVGNSLHNIRIGGSLQWSYKTIDFSRLIFSDELDPKYGAVLPSAFEAPDDGRSQVFFTPSVGIVHKVLLNERSERSPSFTWGLSLHNAYSLGARHLGNEESILGIGTRIPQRWGAFVEAEFIPFYSRRTFFSIRPLAVYQRQSNLQYVETGARFGINRLLSAGIFYHFNQQSPEQGKNTNWFSFSLEFGEVLGQSKRIDLGLSYSNNFSGLRNVVGPVLEVSVALHFASSPGCRLMGREDEVGYMNVVKCPSIAASNRRKMYENIWYK